MALIDNIINLVKCGAGAVLGTGIKGCKPFLKKVSSIWLTPQGFKFDGTRTLNEEYVKELQATGNLIVLKGIRTFADNTPDDTTEELEDGTKQITKLGLYEFMVNFINGLYFNAALNSLSGFGDYDVTFVDRDSNILGTKAADGSLKGFTVGMMQATKLQWATDTTAQREGLMFQFLDRSEVDRDYVFIQGSNLDFNANRIDGINEVVLSYASTPVDLATNVTVKAVTKQDNKPFTGLLFSDFLMLRNGVQNNPTAGDDSAIAGTYPLTVAALALNDDLATQVYDNTLNRNVVILDTDPYKSNIANTVVIA